MKIIHGAVLTFVIASCYSFERAATDNPTSDNALGAPRLKGKRLIVGTIESAPYVQLVQGGNSREFHGFLPDIIKVLSKRLGFQYDLHLVTPAIHGYYDNETNSWTGLIGEVIKRQAPNATDGVDVALAAISITASRQRVVSFVKPFLRLGLTVIIQRPTTEQDNQGDKQTDKQTDKKNSIESLITINERFYFTVVQALDVSVWICMVTATIVVGLMFWGINIYNPYEYGCCYERGLAEKSDAEAFGLRGSLWFTLTTLVCQGYDRAPRSVASKILGCFWFAFVTIFLTTFVAGVLNNLFWASMNSAPHPIPARLYPLDLGHLVTSVSNPYKCGTLANSQTYDYIQRVAVGDQFERLRKIWQTPEGQELLVSNLTEGFRKVRAEKYAFIAERMVANFYMNQLPCDLITIGEDFGTRSYGFALPKNSPYLEEFHGAILELEQEGELEALQRRWMLDGGQCWNQTHPRHVVERRLQDTADASLGNSVLFGDKPRSIDTSTFSSPLTLVILGLSGSAVIAVAEILYYQYRGKYSSQITRRQTSQRMRLESDASSVRQSS